MLTAADIKFFQSDLEGSTGGAMSTLEIPKDQLCLMFGDVSILSGRYGSVDYRKVFAVNMNPSLDFYVARLWLLMQPVDGIKMAIGLGDMTDTDGTLISYSSPSSPQDAIYLGDLMPGAITPIWIQRVVSPNTERFERAFFQLAMTGKALQGV